MERSWIQAGKGYVRKVFHLGLAVSIPAGYCLFPREEEYHIPIQTYDIDTSEIVRLSGATTSGTPADFGLSDSMF